MAVVRARVTVKARVCGPCVSVHRVQLSDGEQWAIGVVTSDCSHLFTSEQVVKNQLVTLKEYRVQEAAGTKMCVVRQMAPVAVEEGADLEKIGGA